MRFLKWLFTDKAKKVGPSPSQGIIDLAIYCNALEDRIKVLERSFEQLTTTLDTARQQDEAEAVPGVVPAGKRLPNPYLEG